MENAEIVNKWGKATKTGDWDTFEALTADNFELHGPAPEPLGKDAYRGWITSLLAANTNHENNFEMSEQSSDVFAGTVQMEGTHSNDWDLSFMGIGVVPASNKHWKNPTEKLTVTVQNGKVVRCDVEVPADGGIPGILAQIKGG